MAIICHANSIKFENGLDIKLDLSHFDGKPARTQRSARPERDKWKDLAMAMINTRRSDELLRIRAA